MMLIAADAVTVLQASHLTAVANHFGGLGVENNIDRVSGDEHHVALAGIFVQIGLLPNTNWLEGTVE
jgi:alkyl hydroperoxide reductase subunit AhpF